MKKIMLFIAIAGCALLAQAQPPARQPKPHHAREEDPAQRIDRRVTQRTQQYNLNETQQKQVRDLMQNTSAKMKTVRDKHRGDREAAAPEMKQVRKEYHAQLKTILTPEQYEKWKVDAKARHEKMKEHKARKKESQAPAPSPVKPEDEDDLNILED